MRPHEARVWRKKWRDASKGVPRGRRTTHRVETQAPVPGSSWRRRHPSECEWFGALYMTAGLSVRVSELHQIDMAEESTP
jgi:hypothetical protein